MRNEAISGVKWTSLARGLDAVLALLNIAVLVRLLDRADFGLMAIATFVIGIVNMFMDMGINSAILHFQNMKREEYTSLYWLNWAASIFLCLLLFTVAPAVAEFYEDERLVSIIRLLGGVLLFSALGRQFKTILQKELKFRAMAIGDITGSVSGVIVGITTALIGWGVLSLVAATLTRSLVGNVYFFVRGIPHNPISLRFRWSEVSRFLNIGVWEVMSNVVNYFNREMDTLIIGKLLGTEVLGGYSLAKQLVQKPMAIINPVVTQVATPLLSRLQTSKTDMREGFLKAVNLVASLNFPIYLLLILAAYPILYVYYGPEYVYLTPIVQLFSIYMFIRVTGNPVGSLLIATGRTNLGFSWNVIMLIVFPAFVYAGSLYGMIGVTAALVVMMLVMFLPSWFILIRPLSGAGFKEYLLATLPSRKNSKLVIDLLINFFNRLRLKFRAAN